LTFQPLEAAHAWQSPDQEQEFEMITLKVPDMTCGHCAGVVTKAVQSIDAEARVDIDLKAQTVTVHTTADNETVSRALETAGYPVAPSVSG
jgi:copper chaperone